MAVKYRGSITMPELRDLNEMPIEDLTKTCKELGIGIYFDSCTRKITGYGDQEYPREVNPEDYGIDPVKW